MPEIKLTPIIEYGLTKECSRCKTTGFVTIVVAGIPVPEKCPICHGFGYIEEKKCSK